MGDPPRHHQKQPIDYSKSTQDRSVPWRVVSSRSGVTGYPLWCARTDNFFQNGMIRCLLPWARGFQIPNFYFRSPFEPAYTVWSLHRNPQAANRVGLVRKHKHAGSLRTIREPFRRGIILREPDVGPDSLIVVVDRVLPRQRDDPFHVNCMAPCPISVVRRTDCRQAQRTESEQQCAQRACTLHG